ncbi:hypothetical protein XCY_000159 [Xanthomonas arboricola pv. juglandis]|uniref:hypothetical protein n=1 Tax=Xanthomonas arboricola TaxID=56448 RepID=UPI001AF511DC|nr:hypothetical protein [Xanthomonas arboricola]CAG2082545.1 hypothetical protein XCY_000159 [Xanthomonas arboricola pv. juglandis]
MDSITDSNCRRPTYRQAFALPYSRSRQDQDCSVASKDLNALCNEARGFAEYMLLAHGEFIPFGVLMRPDGTIAQVAGDLGVERSVSAEMVELLQASFSQSARLGRHPGRLHLHGDVCGATRTGGQDGCNLYVIGARIGRDS